MTTAIYTRISQDDEREGKGVARQQEDCTALAGRLGWDAHGIVVYTENDTSATRGRRPVYDRLMSDVRTGVVTHLVVWDADRLTRTPREGEDLIDLVENHGLKVANATGDEDLTTSDGRLMFRIKVAVARREVEQIKKRVSRSNDQRAAAGEPHGQVGYGYRRADGAVVIEPSEAAIIREAVRRVLAGDSLRHVCADFQARGVPTPGRGDRWNTTTLKQLILRPSIAGLRQHRGVIVGKINAEPIIDADTRDRLVALLTDPARLTSKGGRTPKHLLSGLARCGKCGDSLGGRMHRLAPWANEDAKSTKTQPAAYACSTCHGVRRKQEPVDEFVEELILRRLEMPDAARVFSRGDNQAATAAREALATINARLATAADAFADGSIDGSQLKRITERLRSEKSHHEAVLVASMPATVPADVAGPHARAVWAGLPMETRRRVLDTLAVITIRPGGAGRAFDPDLIEVSWR